MTEARYHELLGRMLDSRISEADADELRHGLETDQARLPRPPRTLDALGALRPGAVARPRCRRIPAAVRSPAHGRDRSRRRRRR